MSALREVIASFGIEFDEKKLKAVDKGVEGLIAKLGNLGKVLLGGAAAVGVLEFAKGLSETGAALDDASVRLGIGTDALQQLGFAADQSGSSIEALTVGMLMLQDKVGDALVNASGEGAKSFHKYGIAIKDASGNVKDASQLFEDIAEKIHNTKDAAKQVTMATDLFGKQGRALLPTLKEGNEGLARLRDLFEDLGGGFSKKAVKAAADYDDALSRFRLTITGLKGQIAVVLLPILQRFVDMTSRLVAGIVGILKNGMMLQTILGLIGVALARAAVPLIRLGVAWAVANREMLISLAKWAALALIIEDLVVLFKGGKSVIGEFIDELFGVGTAAKAVEFLKDTWNDVLGAIKDAVAAIRIFNKLKGHKDLDEDDLKAMRRIMGGGDEPAVTHGIAGRSNADNLRMYDQSHGRVAVLPGESEKQAATRQARLVAGGGNSAFIHQENKTAVHIHGADKKNAKDIGEEVDRKLRQRHREAADVLIKKADKK
jgi:hypothetical protein